MGILLKEFCSRGGVFEQKNSVALWSARGAGEGMVTSQSDTCINSLLGKIITKVCLKNLCTKFWNCCCFSTMYKIFLNQVAF